MPARALGSILAVIFFATACHTMPPPVAPTSGSSDHFAIVLEHSAKGLAAHCETGCQWVDVSMSCGGCEVKLDASGIGPAYPAISTATGFAFVLSPAAKGWKARAIQGTRWKSLSWSCDAATCRVRLDETGVGPV
jgi:hypothetical protein